MSQHQQSLGTGRAGHGRDSTQGWKLRLFQVHERIQVALQERRLTTVSASSIMNSETVVSFEELQRLVKDCPPDSELTTKEKTILSELRRVLETVRGLIAQIEASSESQNLVKFAQMTQLASRITSLRQALAERRSRPWTKAPFTTTLVDLRAKVTDWEKGRLPESDYEFGLLHHHLDFMSKLVREIPTPIKPSSNLGEESLQEFQDRLRDLSLVLSDVQTPITCWLEAKRILDEIFELTKRPMSADRMDPPMVGLPHKERSMLGKIVDEIKVWNRKKLSAIEFHQLQDKLAKLKVYVGELDTKDSEWVQFTNKIEAYCWRQEARLKLESVDLHMTDDEIRELLHRCPREIVDTKGPEWTMLLQKSPNIEMLPPKQTEERIQAYLNQKLGTSDWVAVCNFMANAKIGHQSDDFHKKLEVFEKAANARCFMDTVDLESLQTLVEEMLERKLWSTTTFSLFDEVLKTAKDLKEAAYQARQSSLPDPSPLGDEATPLESLKQQLKLLRQKKDKLFVSRVEELVQLVERLPHKVRDGLRDDVKNLQYELSKIAAFKEAKRRTLPSVAVQICTQQETSSWKSLVWQVGDILTEYRNLQFRDQFIEEWFSIFDTLLTATWGLHNPVFGLPAWENMMNELKIMTSLIQQEWAETSTEIGKAHAFPDIVTELTELCKKIEAPITRAKDFVKIVNQIKYATVEESQRLTLTEAKAVLASHKASQTPILMSDSEEFLEDCITKVQTLEPLGSQEILEYHQLQEAVRLLDNIGLRLDANMSEILRSKLSKANKYKARLSHSTPEHLELQFESLAEEYTGLCIKMEQVEAILNTMQADRDTLEQLKDTEPSLGELQFHQLLQLRDKIKKVVYFRVTFQEVLAKYYQALFTGLNDLISGRFQKKIPVNPEYFELKIKFEDLCHMIEELNDFIGLSESTARPTLLKLLSESKQIQKEVSEHYATRVQSTSQSNTPKAAHGEIHKDVIDMSSFLKEQGSFKKMLAEPQTRYPFSKDEPKGEKFGANRLSSLGDHQSLPRARSRERDRDGSNQSDTSELDLEPFKHDLGSGLLNSEGHLLPLSENRGYSVKKIKDVLWNSKIYEFPDQKEATHIAKCLEALASNSNIISGTSYTKTVDDLVKSLRDVMSYPYIVNHLKQTKFSLDSIQLILGKNPSELKLLNLELKQRPQNTSSGAVEGKPVKAMARQSRLSGLIDSLSSRPPRGELQPEGQIPHQAITSQPRLELRSFVSGPPVSIGPLTHRNPILAKRPIPAEKPPASDPVQKKPKQGSLLTGIEEYRHYQVFKGPVMVQQSENTATSYPEVQLACASASQAILSKFCALQPGTNFTVKVSQQAFENYVRKCLQSASKYSYLAGVVTPFPQDDTLKQSLQEKKVVASVQYTSACKVFLLPSDFFSEEWSQTIELVIPVDKEVALYFLIVRKMMQGDEAATEDKTDLKINPEVIIGEKKVAKLRPNGVKQPIKLVQFEPEAPQVVPHDTLQEIQQNVPTREHLFLDYRIKHANPAQNPQPGVIKVIHRLSQVLEIPNSYPKPAPAPTKAPVQPEPPAPVIEEPVQSFSKAEKISFVVKSINTIFSDQRAVSKSKQSKKTEESQVRDERSPRHQESETSREPVILSAEDKDASSRLSGLLEQITGVKRRAEVIPKAPKPVERGSALMQAFKMGPDTSRSGRESSKDDDSLSRRTGASIWQPTINQKFTAKQSAEQVEADLLSMQKNSFDAGDFSALRDAARSKPSDLFAKKVSLKTDEFSKKDSGDRSFMSPARPQRSGMRRPEGSSPYADLGTSGLHLKGQESDSDRHLGKRQPERPQPDFSAIQEAAKLMSPLQALQHSRMPPTAGSGFLQPAINSIQEPWSRRLS